MSIYRILYGINRVYKSAFILEPAYERMAHERYRRRFTISFTLVRSFVHSRFAFRYTYYNIVIYIIYLVPIKLLSSEVVLPKSRMFNLKIQKFLQDPNRFHFFFRFVQVSF
jgi:hypothetical protein